jgi:formylglycine-generating enzyme required for sulfatase activity
MRRILVAMLTLAAIAGCNAIIGVDPGKARTTTSTTTETTTCSAAAAACVAPEDCPAPGACADRVCAAGCCATTPLAEGTTCDADGGRLCDGAGRCVACRTPSDCPAQQNACVANVCSGNACGTFYVPAGTTCTDGGKVCDGAGHCVGCNVAGDCDVSETCDAAHACRPFPSCAALAPTCGPGGGESCCASPAIPGGTFDRGDDSTAPATLSDFRLDRFEITVGRFRAYVAAYPASKPAAGAGAHPAIDGSGWDPAWDASLPADQAALLAAIKCDATYQTWTDTAGSNEDRPMTCLSWFDAFAFCAWDGGRLPTEAEWSYASAGGNEERVFPWSSPPSSIAIDATFAVYDCTGDGSAAGTCGAGDIQKVGARSPKGDGKWGHADLAGNMAEWALDWYATSYASPCIDCANLQAATSRVLRGGSWFHHSDLAGSFPRASNGPQTRNRVYEARCARPR